MKKQLIIIIPLVIFCMLLLILSHSKHYSNQRINQQTVDDIMKKHYENAMLSHELGYTHAKLGLSLEEAQKVMERILQ